MNKFEILADKYHSEVPIIECDLLDNTGFEGNYRNNYIFIDRNLKTTRKKEILAEEIGHHLTTVGNIININSILDNRQEIKARSVGYELAVPLDSLVDCSVLNLTEIWQCADFVGVEPEYFFEALENYQQINGNRFIHNGYLFDFHYGNGLTITDINT